VFKANVRRVVTTAKVDDRRDVKRSMEEKVRSLKEDIRRSTGS